MLHRKPNRKSDTDYYCQKTSHKTIFYELKILIVHLTMYMLGILDQFKASKDVHNYNKTQKE